MDNTSNTTQKDSTMRKGSPIVTLTTDWGDHQFFSGMVKGALCSLIDEVRIIDITHHVEQFQARDAAFIVKRACLGFPPGTIHIIDVATEPPFVAVKACGQYYLCCDNGLPQEVFGEDIEEVCRIPDEPKYSGTFAAYVVFPKVAAMLAGGASLKEIGESYTLKQSLTLVNWCPVDPVEEGKGPDSYIVYIRFIDSYGNAYLGITEEEFERLRGDHEFFFDVRSAHVREKMETYTDNPPTLDARRRFRLIASPTGNMELAISGASFVQLMGRRADERVLLKIKDTVSKKKTSQPLDGDPPQNALNFAQGERSAILANAMQGQQASLTFNS